MNTRKALVLFLFVLAVVGAIAWFRHRGTSGGSRPAGSNGQARPQESARRRGTPKGSAPVRPLRSVPELEELVYRTPFDADLELELARASWQKFEKSMKTDEAVASECITAYLVATLESGSRTNVVDESRERFNSLATLASLPEGSYDNAYSLFQMVYEKATRPNIKHILKVRKDLESLCARIRADDRGLQDVIAAQVAVERYLQLAYDVEIGRKQLHVPDGGTLHFTESHYKDWEKEMRSYGAIVENNPNAPNSELITHGSLSAPIDAEASQIDSGVKFGRFRLPDGREVIPGLRYFEDASKAATKLDSSGIMPPSDAVDNLGDSSSVNSPVGVYRRMLELREQGQWSAAFDLIDADTQRRFAAAVKDGVRQQLTDPNELQSLDALSDREVWIFAGQTGEVHPTEIMAVKTDGDMAVIKTRTLVGGSYLNADIDCVRVNGMWTLIIK